MVFLLAVTLDCVHLISLTRRSNVLFSVSYSISLRNYFQRQMRTEFRPRTVHLMSFGLLLPSVDIFLKIEIVYIKIQCTETQCFLPQWEKKVPPEFFSLWGWLDFKQTCLAWRIIFLTAGLTSPISRAATARSEWTSALQTGRWRGTWKNRRESTSNDGLASTTDSWLQRAGYEHDRQPRATGFESSALFFFLSRIYAGFRERFFFLFAALGIWFDYLFHW